MAQLLKDDITRSAWRRSRLSGATFLVACASPSALLAQSSETAVDVAAGTTLETVQVSGNWLGSGLQNSVRRFAGARTLVNREAIDDSGAASIGDFLRRIPGVQSTENSGTAGSAISLNIGVRGLTGRYSPRSTVLLDGVPIAVAPYGQPQLSFAPVSLNNVESIDVVRGAGAVRYGPQNVGGIINFTTRSIPSGPDIIGDASARQNVYGKGGGRNTQYHAFVGMQSESGLGLALLYSGMTGSDWRVDSDEAVNDLALKFRYEFGPGATLYGKLSYFDVKSRTPGGLTVAQYEADLFQNTRPTDFWSGNRKSMVLGYVVSWSATQEFEIRTYYNNSTRLSKLINAAKTQLANQPRNYGVLGIEPRYTQRLETGSAVHDVTVGYRFVRERGDDNAFNETLASGAVGATTTFDNSTDAHAIYLDDKIAISSWRITPGIRFERIATHRFDGATGQTFDVKNDKPLPSINVARLLSEELTIFANYNTSFGPVQNIQLNSQTPANPLQPELARTVEFGGRWTSPTLSAELTVFRIRFDNQIQQIAGVTPATFQNIGATQHEGVESAIGYSFARDGALAGLSLNANYTYSRALQGSGPTAGLDVPFYSRNTDTVSARYVLGARSFNLSTTHQSGQFSDNANTVAETASAALGQIPGYRLWNAQISWKPPIAKGVDLVAGVNNVADARYFTRNIDGNAGRMVGSPRAIYLQGRYAF